VAALGHIADNELACVEPKVGNTRDWVERSQQQMRGMVWSQPSVKHSFYKNAYGEVYILSPWRVVDYWSWTREFDRGDYVIRKRAELAGARSTE
jgi:4-hydroxyacetophenone monooxygenase